MNTPSFIIVADRGGLKAFSVEETATRGRMPRLEEAFQISAKPTRFAEKFSDQAGAFPTGGTAGNGNSVAERLPLENELDQRAFREVARHIQDVLSHHAPKSWGFAAPSEIQRAILEDLPADAKTNLQKVVARDLIHAGPAELLSQFAA